MTSSSTEANTFETVRYPLSEVSLSANASPNPQFMPMALTCGKQYARNSYVLNTFLSVNDIPHREPRTDMENRENRWPIECASPEQRTKLNDIERSVTSANTFCSIVRAGPSVIRCPWLGRIRRIYPYYPSRGYLQLVNDWPAPVTVRRCKRYCPPATINELRSERSVTTHRAFVRARAETMIDPFHLMCNGRTERPQ